MFGGQGTQSLGMSRAIFQDHVLERSPFLQSLQQHLRHKYAEIYNLMTFDSSTSSSAIDVVALSDRLTLTRNAQPAILAHCIALWTLLKDRADVVQWTHHHLSEESQHDKNSLPVVALRSVLGHSLGEYSAMVANETISFEDAMHLVRKRGEFMEDCIYRGRGDAGEEKVCKQSAQYGMAAVLNVTAEELETVIDKLKQDPEYHGLVCDLANLNSMEQVHFSFSLSLSLSHVVCNKNIYTFFFPSSDRHQWPSKHD